MKRLELVEYLRCSGRVIRDDARCALDTKSRIVIAKAAFNKKKLFSPPNDTLI
jgi:hypothetical protein